MRVSWLGVLGVAACQFDRPANVGEEDARAIDAAPSCVANTITCADGVYTECDPLGFPLRQMQCPLACAPDEAACLDIDPHNGLAMYLDLVADPPDVVLSGNASIDTMNGAIFDDGVGVIVPSFDLPAVRLRVFVVNSLTIDGSVTVAARDVYTYAFAIVSRGDILIRGPFDISANARLAGPGGRISGYHSDTLPCDGWEVFTSLLEETSGASGAGGATDGGGGGYGGNGTVMGGAADAVLEPLWGGCYGGYVSAPQEPLTAWGGGGGGAVQLSSRTRIGFSASGSIDASGGGGQAGFRDIAGAGGGGGGKILLEAPQVVIDGADVVLSTKGGGGSGASSSTMATAGADGGTGSIPAPGGMSPIGSIGGRGGASGPPFGGADATGGGVCGGGGGGAAGTTAVFTLNGAVAPQSGAAIRGGLVTGVLPTRRIP